MLHLLKTKNRISIKQKPRKSHQALPPPKKRKLEQPVEEQKLPP
jgi:hypothetical protein